MLIFFRRYSRRGRGIPLQGISLPRPSPIDAWLRCREAPLGFLLLRRPMRRRQAAMDAAFPFPWKGARSASASGGFAPRVATQGLIGRGEGFPPCRARAAEKQVARLGLDHIPQFVTHNGFLMTCARIGVSPRPFQSANQRPPGAPVIDVTHFPLSTSPARLARDGPSA